MWHTKLAAVIQIPYSLVSPDNVISTIPVDPAVRLRINTSWVSRLTLRFIISSFSPWGFGTTGRSRLWTARSWRGWSCRSWCWWRCWSCDCSSSNYCSRSCDSNDRTSVIDADVWILWHILFKATSKHVYFFFEFFFNFVRCFVKYLWRWLKDNSYLLICGFFKEVRVVL